MPTIQPGNSTLSAGSSTAYPGRITGMIWLLIPWIITAFFLLILTHNRVVEQNLESTVPSPPMHEGDMLVQPLPLMAEPVDGITLRIGTYRRINHGLMEVTVETGTESRTFDLDVSRIVDNEWRFYPFPEMRFSDLTTGLIRITARQMTPGEFVSPWCSPAAPDQEVLIPSEPGNPLTLSYKLHHRESVINLLFRFWADGFPAMNERMLQICFLISLLVFILTSSIWIHMK